MTPENNCQDPMALFRALKNAWSEETASPPSGWNTENPAKNHCSVTSLIAQDYFGGDIVKTKTAGGTHFYNIIDGKIWDLTISQFLEPIAFDNTPSTREDAIADTSEDKYQKLAERVRVALLTAKSSVETVE